MMKLPDDMFKQELLQYLTVDDIVNLDNACLSHKYRPQLMDKINGVILLGDKDKSIKASLLKWLGMRRIYPIEMQIQVSVIHSTSAMSIRKLKNDYVDQFRYTQYVVLRGPILDDMAIFIVSHCPSLLLMNIIDDREREQSNPQITDHTLHSIAEYCTGLQTLSFSCCQDITDTGLIIISVHCPYLRSLKVAYCQQITDGSIISISTYCTGLKLLNLGDCDQITDASINSISTHCTGLQSLNLYCCRQITDASIISISTHCTGLQSLHLGFCRQMTDASIISISTHCSGLQSLNLEKCAQITDASIISISTHCTGLQSLRLRNCHKITDASIIPTSENCTWLKRLNVFGTSISDASLIAIVKNCTGLQFLDTDGCHGISSYQLRDEFKSVSELRAVLLSIYPSLPI